ncbi:DUF7144 family membrane protein [Streptomyces hawaiiensis]|uniref:DUF7144 domain-containing protein n=1 Tax=Streptomyces hawaiiensis TaxID=67305 RepID=A0A6G5RM90_9ACTN|nr:hypothetical protein [Streptomyces hawaiiensis]QCD59265.1 hypothetical protein CEB94_34030 [Streptomyces hawaiiensis]
MTATHPTHGHTTAKHGLATGMMVFAAVMLMIAGILAVFRGIAAIAEDEVFVSTRNYIFEFDLTGWGWIHLALGVAAVLISMGLFQGAGWARVTGVGIAGLVIIANFLSLPAYPVWSVIMIAMSAFIIWALCSPRKGDT